jgi:hypothetical protein
MVRKVQRIYVCAECGGAVTQCGTGLGTWTCPKHPKRLLNVERRVDSGKEAERSSMWAGVPVVRHTKVRAVLRAPDATSQK